MDVIVIFLIGFAASYVSGLVGGGGLVSIPALIFLGIPPQVAIATNKLGGYGHNIGSTWRYYKAKKIAWEYFWLLVILGTFGGVIGANLLATINEEVLMGIVGILLLLAVIFLLVKKDLGIKRMKPTRENKTKGSVLFFFAQIYGGFFGGGTAFFSMPILMHYFGLTAIEANATRVPPAFLFKIAAIWIYIASGFIYWDVAGVLFVSNIIGSYTGAHTAVKKGNKTVKNLFVAFVAFSAVKMLFF